jgi:murein L,D-transpeptidase YcbB/YkuD
MDSTLTRVSEYIVINIPAFKLTTETAIKNWNLIFSRQKRLKQWFSAGPSVLLFSPYWNVPRSIIENELKQAIFQDENYLESHGMEWNNGNIRQRPGPKPNGIS